MFREKNDAIALLFWLGMVQNTFERMPNRPQPRTEAAMRKLNNEVTFTLIEPDGTLVDLHFLENNMRMHVVSYTDSHTPGPYADRITYNINGEWRETNQVNLVSMRPRKPRGTYTGTAMPVLQPQGRGAQNPWSREHGNMNIKGN